MIRWNVILDTELVEQRPLRNLPRPHHPPNPSILRRLNQARKTTSTANFSTPFANLAEKWPSASGDFRAGVTFPFEVPRVALTDVLNQMRAKPRRGSAHRHGVSTGRAAHCHLNPAHPAQAFGQIGLGDVRFWTHDRVTCPIRQIMQARRETSEQFAIGRQVLEDARRFQLARQMPGHFSLRSYGQRHHRSLRTRRLVPDR